MSVALEGRRVRIEGAYRREAPDGEWTCTDETSGAVLVLRYDAERWARQAWGVALSDVPAPGEGPHIGVAPDRFCPAGDWEVIARDGWLDPQLGDLTEFGVRVVELRPGSAAER